MNPSGSAYWKTVWESWFWLNENAGQKQAWLSSQNKAATLYNKIQHYFREKTRLGIPVMTHEKNHLWSANQDATKFPYTYRTYQHLEWKSYDGDIHSYLPKVRARGGHRTGTGSRCGPWSRWGRTEELLGEDPAWYPGLLSLRSKAWRRWVYLGANKVATTLKHLRYSWSEWRWKMYLPVCGGIQLGNLLQTFQNMLGSRLR